MTSTKILKLKIKISLVSALKVFKNPLYVLLAGLFMILVSAFILWSLNLDLIAYILFQSPLDLAEKFDFFFSIYQQLYTDFSSFQSTGLIVFSLLFGLNIAVLIYVLRNIGFKKVPKRSGAAGLTLALISGGCVACGTSLLAPLAATLGASATPFLRDLSAFLNWAGSLLIAYSIYKLGGLVAYANSQKLDKN